VFVRLDFDQVGQQLLGSRFAGNDPGDRLRWRHFQIIFLSEFENGMKRSIAATPEININHNVQCLSWPTLDSVAKLSRCLIITISGFVSQ